VNRSDSLIEQLALMARHPSTHSPSC
jgi:hypothetical protein